MKHDFCDDWTFWSSSTWHVSVHIHFWIWRHTTFYTSSKYKFQSQTIFMVRYVPFLPHTLHKNNPWTLVVLSEQYRIPTMDGQYCRIWVVDFLEDTKNRLFFGWFQLFCARASYFSQDPSIQPAVNENRTEQNTPTNYEISRDRFLIQPGRETHFARQEWV